MDELAIDERLVGDCFPARIKCCVFIVVPKPLFSICRAAFVEHHVQGTIALRPVVLEGHELLLREVLFELFSSARPEPFVIFRRPAVLASVLSFPSAILSLVVEGDHSPSLSGFQDWCVKEAQEGLKLYQPGPLSMEQIYA